MTKRAKRKVEKAALSGGGFHNEDGQGNTVTAILDMVPAEEVGYHSHS